MLYQVSIHLLDLRFVITQPFGDDPRSLWLRPQWLWAGNNRPQVGRIGAGAPIPGRDRILPAFSQHATVPGHLVLQTDQEWAEKRAVDGAEQDGFALLHREIIADEWGQVRFDLLIEDRAPPAALLHERLDALLNLRLVAALDGGASVGLGDAADAIARQYERESLKTSEGFADPARRADAVNAAAGTVSVAAETPQVILIDLGADPGGGAHDAAEVVTQCEAPCAGTLTLLKVDGIPPDTLCWQLRVTHDAQSRFDPLNAAWSAAFGLSWLVGNLHELVVLQARVVEYERRGTPILPDLVRTSIKRRNNRFGMRRFGGWNPQEVLAGAARMMWIERGEAENRLRSIQGLMSDQRDAGGVTSNIVNVVNLAREITMSSTTTTITGNVTNSNLNFGSTLTNVTQSIGQLPNTDQSTKEELTRLVEQLHAELKTLSETKSDRGEQIDAVAASTEELVTKAKADKPNKTLLQQAIDGAKAIAEKLDAEKVLSIVGTIGGIIAKLHGL
jgi:hypothetical protein